MVNGLFEYHQVFFGKPGALQLLHVLDVGQGSDTVG